MQPSEKNRLLFLPRIEFAVTAKSFDYSCPLAAVGHFYTPNQHNKAAPGSRSALWSLISDHQSAIKLLTGTNRKWFLPLAVSSRDQVGRAINCVNDTVVTSCSWDVKPNKCTQPLKLHYVRVEFHAPFAGAVRGFLGNVVEQRRLSDRKPLLLL